MAKIFISYRREDSRSITDRIFDRLKNTYVSGEVFKDVNSIPVGHDFVASIDLQLASAEVVLIIVGWKWAATFQSRAATKDYVKLEILGALKQNKPIIPVFVEGCEGVDQHELPEELQSIATLNGIQVRHDPDFDSDVQRLIEIINQNLTSKNIYTPPKLTKTGSRKLLYIAAAAIAVVVFSWFYMTREHCDYPKRGVLIANFMDKDRDGFSNSIVTMLDNSLSDSIYDVRPVGNQPREVKNYGLQLQKKYFSSKCQPSGVFVNGFLDREQEVFNLYGHLFNMTIEYPDFINDNAFFLNNPENIEFSIREDAQFVANFVLAIINMYDGNEKHSLEIFSLLEVDEKINLKNPEFLTTIALYKGNSYALRGDEARASVEYAKAKKSVKPEIREAAEKNAVTAEKISNKYKSEPELTRIRTNNIRAHGQIENDLLKILEEGANAVAKGLQQLFTPKKKKR